jgi:DNA-binding transcriptional MerR regulator
MASEQGYGVKEVQKVVGVTYRQLDYWARTELVVPSVRDAEGSGSQRLYSFQDILKLRIIKSLLDTGVTLQKIRTATNFLTDIKQAPHGTTLISDGNRVYAKASPEFMLDLLAKGQGVFAISIESQWTDLEKALSKGRRGQTARAGGS